MVKIVTWNINGLRSILTKDFGNVFDKDDYDGVFIQEIKVDAKTLSELDVELPGYYFTSRSADKKGYSGVGAYVKNKPLNDTTLGVSDIDSEGRVQVLYYDKYVIVNAYFPNSQDKGKRLEYKAYFCGHIFTLMKELRSKYPLVILCGDYNIAHRSIDLARPEDNEQSPGYFPIERELMETYLNDEFVDVYRHFHPDSAKYTWWSYRTRARQRDIGWRIDYFSVPKKV